MTIDPQTLVIGSTLLPLAVITSLWSPFFRRPRIEDDNTEETHQDTPLSVIMTVHNQAEALERNLPVLLSLPYKAGYEVIVVDESSTDETNEVLDRLKEQYPNLYTTYIPDSSHYISRRKLAIMMGIKAAKNEWMILTEATCTPQQDTWLQTVASHINDDTDMICGYTNYDESAPSYYVFDHLLANCYLMKQPYRYEGANLAFRKSAFLAGNGFLNNLKYLYGEYDFMVNACSRVSVMTAKSGRLTQEAPCPDDWKKHQIRLRETRRHLRHTLIPHLLFASDQLMMYVNYMLQLAAIVYAALTQRWLLLGVASAGLLLTLVLRTLFACKAAKAFSEHIAAIKLPFMELRVGWQEAWFRLKHKLADKYEFIRK